MREYFLSVWEPAPVLGAFLATKFRGVVGYADEVEKSAGNWQPVITERTYSGDVLRVALKNQNSGGVNDNLVVDNRISIVADPYALKHFSLMRYVCWMGVRWKISSVDASQRPRLILTIGEVYNGNEIRTSEPS